MARGQAERLLPMLEEMLIDAGAGWADLAGLGLVTGPGNFTGIRLAVAAARGLALALGIPAVGATLFEVLAEGLPGPILVALPGRGDGTWAQTFRDGVATAAPTGDLSTLAPFDPATLVIGWQAATLAASIGLHSGPEVALADPEALARLTERRLDAAPPPAPLYLLPADALPSSEAHPILIDDA